MVTPDIAGLRRAAEALRAWQADRAPMQLHPGDLGFHWRDGTERTASDLRVWSRGERVVAVGLLDAPQLLRMAVSPDLQSDDEIIERVLTDIEGPERGVLDAGVCTPSANVGAVATYASAGFERSPDARDLRRDG